MGFFRFFAKRHLLAYIITLVIIMLGASSLFTIKRDAFPSVEFGELLVTTTYPGASPEDVELLVTNELEKEIKEVTGIKRYMSWSRENVSTVHIVIDPDVDDDERVIRDIREAVSRVTDLPEEVTESPLVTELSTSSFPIIEIGLAGELPYSALRKIARRFEKKLENVDGVAKVQRYGYRAREVQIEVDPKKLARKIISLGAMVRAISQRNVRATGGSFESYTSEKNIVTLAQFQQPAEVGDVIVRTTFTGPSVKIKDLAVVKDDFEEEKILSRINGKKAISFVAFKAENADIIRTVDAIREMVAHEQQFMPPEIEIMVSNDESKYVKDRLSIVANNGLLGLALVLCVLAFFLSLRIAFWVALGIPVALLGAIFMLPVFDSFLDSVTMTAMVLVLGIIVDDAIIIAESIYQCYEKGMSAVNAAVTGVRNVIKPVITTMLTTFVVFFPMFFMPGMLGKFVYVIPLVITLALIISLIESTMALPAHLAAGMKPQAKPTFSQRMFKHMRHSYATQLMRILGLRYLLVLSFIVVLGAALYYAHKYMDFVLFPSSTAERFLVLIETPVGTSLPATADVARKVEAVVSSSLDKSELDSFVTRIGTYGEIGSSERENNAAIIVSLTPFADRVRTADEIVESLRAKTDQMKAVERIYYMIDSGGPPVGRPITIRVVGVDDQLRTRLADDINKFVEAFDGTKDISRDDKIGKTQVEIKFDYDKLARVGISVADVARNVRIAYDGEVVTSVRYGDEDVEFRVIFSKDVRKNPNSLGELTLPNRNGYLTSLKEVARFVSTPGPANFTHYNSDRAITISGDIDKEKTTPLKVSEAVQKRFDVDRDYPGLSLIIGGEAEESQKSVNELMAIMIVAIIGIYLLLILLFNSLWQPLLVIMAIPFGIVGVIVGFSIHNEALGFLGMIGVIGLSGVVVNDSLVLVAHINELRQQHPHKTITEVVAEGTSNRLRAVLLTTISTVAGLLPLAYGIGGADPYMGPMALALGWGLLFATPLTLLLVPCLYMIWADIQHLIQYKQLKETE
jgi:multidrug efflux pump subunit AcrB